MAVLTRVTDCWPFPTPHGEHPAQQGQLGASGSLTYSGSTGLTNSQGGQAGSLQLTGEKRPAEKMLFPSLLCTIRSEAAPHRPKQEPQQFEALGRDSLFLTLLIPGVRPVSHQTSFTSIAQFFYPSLNYP